MDLDKLAALKAVVEEGTQERAAERLFCTQSALSKQLAALENQLGRPLFLRRGKGLILNQDGERTYRFALKVLAEWEALFTTWREDEQRPAEIRLGVTGSIGIYQLPVVLDRAKAELPRLPVRFVIGSCPRLLSLLAAEEIGLALLPQGTPFHPGENCQCWPLFTGRMLPVVPSGHPLARQKGVPLSRLCSSPFLLSGGDSATRHFSLGLFRERGLMPKEIQDFGSVEAIKEGVRLGLGVSILPEAAVTRELAAGALDRCDLEGGPLRRRVDCVLLRGRRLTTWEQRLLDYFPGPGRNNNSTPHNTP